MKGLLQKDLYMIWRYGRTLLLISLVFLAVSVMGESRDNFFFVIYPVLFGGVLPVTLISYEERCGWNSWCDTMPVSRSTVVNARYVCTFLCFLALYLLTLAVQAVVRIPRGEGKALLELAQVLPAMGLVTPAVMLPVTLRWGVEKGRLVYYVVIGLLVGVVPAADAAGLRRVLAAVGQDLSESGILTILPKEGPRRRGGYHPPA